MKRLIRQLTPRVASADLRITAGIPALVGALTVLVGCAVEAHGQAELVKTAGVVALDVYRASMDAMQLPLLAWLQEGVAGNLPSFGGNTQATGAAFMAVAPVVSAVTVFAARIATGARRAAA